jgi:hypothetical protein
MLPKYNDFLVESQIINLLLEGTLDASPEFLDRFWLRLRLIFYGL